ncbi:MAG: single-stranded DNA-binding protein [Timaviella obliquedivisa GSE-PSE-MK23-08B]|jgi:single-stranded DNA-binding protein|nr:single-stranded DNA-binding protein [Timaviella obliquedivisa GSE-PSE-MK23-08B]
MNSCILMAEITQDPQLRYTSDNQTAVAEMVVQFAGLRDDEPMATMKVVGWGNLAQEIQERYHQGDRVIIEGRLGMNTVERQEGFKEKRAELTAQKIHLLDAGTTMTTTTEAIGVTRAVEPTPVASAPTSQPSSPPIAAKAAPARVPAAAAKAAPPVESFEDEIPF